MLVPGNEICKKLVFMFGYRVMSRVCVVPFLKPSITAATDRELDAFDDLDEMIEEGIPTQALGWIIRQKDYLHDNKEARDMKHRLKDTFQGRSLMNWAVVSLATIMVCS